jgi:kumamolisin
MRKAAAATLVFAVAIGAFLFFRHPDSPRPPARAAAFKAGLSLEDAIRASRRLGETTASTPIDLTLSLRGRNPAELGSLLTAGATISSTEYDSRFGPDPAEVQKVLAALTAAGLRADWTPGAGYASASGPAAAVEAFLGLTLFDYQGPDGSRFYAPDHEAQVPAQLGPAVTGIAGLDSYGRMRNHVIRSSGLTPADVLNFYDIKKLRDQGLDGSGETIVMPEIDDLPNLNDIQLFSTRNGLPAPDVKVRTDPAWGKPDNPGKPGVEVSLDVEIAHAIAPMAKIVVYTGSSRFDLGAKLFDTMVRENQSAIISDSIGACEMFVPDSVRQMGASAGTRAVAQQLTHYVAAGDEGAYDCGQDKPPGVDFMSSLPTVTTVGGTTAFVGKGGSYIKEAAWGSPISQAGTGGGLSRVYSMPDYQQGIKGKLSNGMRQIPDVAAVADGNTGWAIIVGGEDHTVGGTSAAAPLWAGLTALINQGLRKQGLRRVGFANPFFYAVNSSSQRPTGVSAPAPFHEVTEGNNLLYQAGAGWNFTTGWGTPVGSALYTWWVAYIKSGKP